MDFNTSICHKHFEISSYTQRSPYKNLHKNVHSSIIPNTPKKWKQPICPSIDECLKGAVLYNATVFVNKKKQSGPALWRSR